MPSKFIEDFLEKENIDYTITKHPKAYTAQEIAAVSHIPGKKMAKTVLVKADGKFKMIVLPASYHINIDQLKLAIGAEKLRLAYEYEFKDLFPDCEVGAMPPLGNLYGIEVIVAASLVEDDEIVFNAGNHIELIKMKFRDFERVTHPNYARFTSKNLV